MQATDRSRQWSDESPYSGAGFARIDTTMSCVLTRFRLRSCLLVIPFYLSFLQVRRAARDIEGFVKAIFLVEDAHTCYTLSLWKNDCAIVDFGSLRAHVKAANSAFRSIHKDKLGRAEIWSAQFRLWAVSHNLSWQGLDLQSSLGDQWERRARVAGMGAAVEVSSDAQ